MRLWECGCVCAPPVGAAATRRTVLSIQIVVFGCYFRFAENNAVVDVLTLPSPIDVNGMVGVGVGVGALSAAMYFSCG